MSLPIRCLACLLINILVYTVTIREKIKELSSLTRILNLTMNGNCVTLRALMPYLVLYRILGLIPFHFQSENKNDELLAKQWNWKRIGLRLYSAILLLSVTAFLVEHLFSLLKPSSEGIVANLESTNIASFSLNILVILIICFSYLGKRVCRLLEGMLRCEREMIAIGCSLQTDDDKVHYIFFSKIYSYSLLLIIWICVQQNGNLVIYCWAALLTGIVATVMNELAYLLCNDHNHLFHDESLPTNGTNSASSHFKITSIGCFRMIMTPFAAGIWPFIDYSIIQLSLVLSVYQRSLRKRIGQWSCINLNEKEHIRITYWAVQSLIKVSYYS